MKLLLDTHVFLWFVMGDEQLSAASRRAIEDESNAKYVSAASAWEIAIKVILGKLKLAEPFDVLVPREIAGNGFIYLPVELSHISLISTLPFHHRDPFDRMLIAQTLVEGFVLVSADSTLDQYGIQRIG